MSIAMDRSPAQRETALARANETRLWRAEQKRRMTARYASELILDPPMLAQSWRLYDLLKSVPKVGPSKAHRIMKVCQVGAGRSLGSLTVRQRPEVIQALERWL